MSAKRSARVQQPLDNVEERITYQGLGPQVAPEVALHTEEVSVDIQGMIDEVLQGKKFDIEPADAFKSGKEILDAIRPVPISGVTLSLESGRREKATVDMILPEAIGNVYGVTLPGVKGKSGQYLANQDGMVMAYDSIEGSLTAGIIHNESAYEEGAAVANVEAVSAAYDMARLRSPALTEMFFRMNNRAAPIEKELGQSFPHAALIRLNPTKSGLYSLDVASNSGFRCMVIDPSGKFETNEPLDSSDDAEFLPLLYNQPIDTVIDIMLESGTENDKKVIYGLKERLESGKFTEDQVRQFLRNLMLEPNIQSLNAAPEELVVLVPEVAIEEFGGPEAFAQYFSNLLRNGQTLPNICNGLMATLEKTMNGEGSDEGTVGFEDVIAEVYPEEPVGKEKAKVKKPLLEQSMSIIAFEVPEMPGK